MRPLNQLLDDVRVINNIELNPDITGLEYDSRKVEAGNCFFAVVGSASDGHNYIASAIEHGAKAIVCQRMPEELNAEVAYILVEDSNIAMAAMAAFEEAEPVVGAITPVPGGVGTVTTSVLVSHVVEAAQRTI